MVWEPEFVHYACVAHRHQMSSEPTILAEFNSADTFLRDMAHQCIHCAPPNHYVFSHTHLKQTYTFLLCDPFIFFGIFEKNMLKSDQIQFLGRLKEVFNRLIKGDRNYKFSSSCLQGEINPIFHKLLSKSQDFDALQLVSNGVDSLRNKTPPPPISGSSKGRKIFAIKSLSPSKITDGQKKKLYGDGKTENRETLVTGKFDLSGNNGINQVKNREIACHNSVSLIDGGGFGGKQKAKKIWRRHVWVVLILDLAVCLILFGIWLFVCQGFQCLEA